MRLVITQLNAIVKYTPEIESYIQRLESSYIEIKDITRDLENRSELVVANPVRSEEITQQLNILFRLQKNTTAIPQKNLSN